MRSWRLAELQGTLDQMESSLDVTSEMCPYCKTVNLFPGFSKMLVYTCKHRGRPVNVAG
jgi:hypothetical protein